YRLAAVRPRARPGGGAREPAGLVSAVTRDARGARRKRRSAAGDRGALSEPQRLSRARPRARRAARGRGLSAFRRPAGNRCGGGRTLGRTGALTGTARTEAIHEPDQAAGSR